MSGVQQDPVDLCTNKIDMLQGNDLNIHHVQACRMKSNEVISISSDDDVPRVVAPWKASRPFRKLKQKTKQCSVARLPSAKALDDKSDLSYVEKTGLTKQQMDRITLAIVNLSHEEEEEQGERKETACIPTETAASMSTTAMQAIRPDSMQSLTDDCSQKSHRLDRSTERLAKRSGKDAPVQVSVDVLRPATTSESQDSVAIARLPAADPRIKGFPVFVQTQTSKVNAVDIDCDEQDALGAMRSPSQTSAPHLEHSNALEKEPLQQRTEQEYRKSERAYKHSIFVHDVQNSRLTIDLTMDDDSTAEAKHDEKDSESSKFQSNIVSQLNSTPQKVKDMETLYRISKMSKRLKCKTAEKTSKNQRYKPAALISHENVVDSSHSDLRTTAGQREKIDSATESSIRQKCTRETSDSDAYATSDDCGDNATVTSPSDTDEDQALGDFERVGNDELKVHLGRDIVLPERSSRARTSICYQEPEDIMLTAASMITYSRPKSKRETSKTDIRSDKINEVGLKPARVCRKRKTNQKECQNYDRVPEQIDEFFGDADKSVMDAIPHLSYKTFDKTTNLPRQRICVYCCNDETIYEFEVFVKESGIPNSGLGAFMTFLGARVLKSDCAERSSKLLEQRYQLAMPTKETIMALRPEGFGVSLKVTGKNLHHNNNSEYWAAEACPKKVKLPSSQKSVKLFLTGKHLHYDSDEEEAPFVRHQNNSWQVPRLGFLGIHVESDYVFDKSLTFCSTFKGCGYIDLGRYGPNLKADRKPKTLYELKSFIFNGEPAGWGFGVDEPIHGREQIVDITSDATGEISEAAKAMVAIYVNEVGHDPELVQNVHTREKEGRVVQYYVDITTPLRQGETVELLTTYFSQYEENRARKGYGLVNMREGIQDDSHEPSRLQRNLDDRYEVCEMIKQYSMLDLFEACEFIVISILPHISGFDDNFNLTNTNRVFLGPGIQLTPRQIIARRRTHWISSLFEDRIRILMLSSEKFQLQQSSVEEILGQAKKWCQDMKWVQHFMNYDPRHAFGDDLWKATEQELVEEYLFPLRERLPMALNEAYWCPLSVNLTKNLCVRTATSQTLLSLEQAYIDCAVGAATAIRKACNVAPGIPPSAELAFDFGNDGCHQISADELWKCISSLSEPESVLSKGVMAKAADLRAYFDLVDLGLVPRPVDLKNLLMKIQGLVFVSKSPLIGDAKPYDTIGIPRSADCFRRGIAMLNDEWYIVWQVVYVVHAFASYYLRDPKVLESLLESLCTAINVDVARAKHAIESGIKHDVYYPKIEYAPGRKFYKATKTLTNEGNLGGISVGGAKKTRSLDTGEHVFHSGFNKILFDKVIWKTLSSLGWTIESGSRLTDFYFLPPGIKRGKGFRNRRDFFDSKKLVLECCHNHSYWKDKEEVKGAVDLYTSMENLLKRLQAARKLPKGELHFEWLRQQLD